MDKDKKNQTPSSQGKDQDNIGYENTEQRTDRDDRQMDRLQTTDTDNDEGKKPDIAFEDDEDKK